MVSLTAEYALRAVLFLAVEQGRPRTVQQIARMTRVPADYLSKVLQELSRSGLVRSQRGLYGGFRLLPDPKGVTVFDVVQAVSPLHRGAEGASEADVERLSEAPDASPETCPITGEALLAPLQHLLDEVYENVEHRFTDTRIADLIPSEAVPRADAAAAPDPPRATTGPPEIHTTSAAARAAGAPAAPADTTTPLP